MAPFVVPDLEWDFRLSRVVSINVSGHKYGLTYAGIGWAIWRSAEYLPKSLIFNINYLGSDQASFTLNFSKGAAHVIAQYYVLIRLGQTGFRKIMTNLTATADHLAERLTATGRFVIMSESGGRGLPLVAFRLKDEHHYNEVSWSILCLILFVFLQRYFSLIFLPSCVNVDGLYLLIPWHLTSNILKCYVWLSVKISLDHVVKFW